jgi:hypothetical protein
MDEEKPNYRMQRVERLLEELKYEVTRGMLEGDLPDETMGFRFYVPISKAIYEALCSASFAHAPCSVE